MLQSTVHRMAPINNLHNFTPSVTFISLHYENKKHVQQSELNQHYNKVYNTLMRYFTLDSRL